LIIDAEFLQSDMIFF